MAKNLDRYFQTWKLRKEGRTLREVGKIMGFSAERARTVTNYVRFVMRKKDATGKKLIAMLRKSSGKNRNRTRVQPSA